MNWAKQKGNKTHNSDRLSGTGDSQRDSRESIRANRFALETPIFIDAHQADSRESLGFPSRANHSIRATRANRLFAITPPTKLIEKSLLCERCSEEEGKVISSVHSIIKTENIACPERGFERFSELFRGFERFSEVFQRPSQRPSQSAIFLSELWVMLPLVVLPRKTPASPSSLCGEGGPLLLYFPGKKNPRIMNF